MLININYVTNWKYLNEKNVKILLKIIAKKTDQELITIAKLMTKYMFLITMLKEN